jgi:hypothetical protein
MYDGMVKPWPLCWVRHKASLFRAKLNNTPNIMGEARPFHDMKMKMSGGR